MTWPEYRRTTLARMEARRYRTTVAVRTGMVEIPAGTPVRVVGKQNGLTVRGDACPHCGVQVYARKVDPTHLTEEPT